MLSKLQRNQKGFTLIELMIVVVIIGILAALAIPRFMQATGKAKKSEAKSVLKQIYVLERAYFQENDTYVASTGDNVIPSIGWNVPSGTPRYNYTVVAGGTGDIASSFTATATEIADADGDNNPNETLTMDESGATGGDW